MKYGPVNSSVHHGQQQVSFGRFSCRLQHLYRSVRINNVTLSWRLPGAIPTLSDSSASVAAPAVSQAPKSRLGSSDRRTLRDVVRLRTLNCRTLLSEIRQQKLIRFMESRQIDVLAI